MYSLLSRPFLIRQKEEVAMKDWKDKAYDMFFNDGLEINDIAILLEKSRRSIQGYLSTCEAYEHGKEERLQVSLREKSIKGSGIEIIGIDMMQLVLKVLEGNMM